MLNIQSSWLERNEASRHVRWTREFWQAMRPFATGGVYSNFMTADEAKEWGLIDTVLSKREGPQQLLPA